VIGSFDKVPQALYHRLRSVFGLDPDFIGPVNFDPVSERGSVISKRYIRFKYRYLCKILFF
jgi:hypothetical protein